MPYSLLALDLDGTLLDPAGKVSEANVRAVRAAREAGVLVLVCTGRGWVECSHILRAIEQREPAVTAGGSIIAEATTGATLHRFPMDLSVVASTVRTLLEHDHPALVLKDRQGAGYDYLVVEGERRVPLDPVTSWWFREMRVKTRTVRSIDEDEQPEHTVRVGACSRASKLAGLAAVMREAVAGKAFLHHFPAVVAPEHARHAGIADDPMHVLEMFDAQATKWTAIRHIAQQREIPSERIAAIGDEINDHTMITGAGLGVAMGNAIPAIKQAAKRQTLANTQDGVAYAIGKLLEGEW